MIKRLVFQHTSLPILNRIARTRRTGSAAFTLVTGDYWRDNVADETRFLAFCASMRHLGHGQLLQDLWVLFETDLQQGGFFVEFGAFDGVLHSNTLLLERGFGWRGILGEPNPDMAARITRARAADVDSRCVWDRSGEVVELDLTEDPELSSVTAGAEADVLSAQRRSTRSRTAKVPTVSLNDLLEEHGAPADIDFLSVDTEGTEVRILEAFDFSAHRPRLAAVEHNGRRDDEERLDALFTREGYERRFPGLSRWDAWYRRKP